MKLLVSLINADKVGGWVRAGVASGFVAADAKWPVLGSFIDQATEVQLAAALAAVAVGLWSHVAKNLAA
jgi:hypothetical protein